MWELLKSLFFKENVLISVALGSWKINDFQQKQTIYCQNKNKWQIAPDLHKKSENVTLQETMRMFFFIVVVVVVVVDVVVAVVNVVSVVN